MHSLTPFVHELAQSIQPDGATKTLYDGWLERVARAGAGARTASRAEDAAGRRAGIGIRLHRVSRSRRHRVDGHGAERPRRRRQLSLDLRQPDLVQEVHRSAVQVQRARRAGDRRRAAAPRRRRRAAVRLRDLRQADPRVHRRDRAAGGEGVGRRREEDRLRRPAIGGGGVREGGRRRARARRGAAGRSRLRRRRPARRRCAGDQPPADHGRARSDRAGRPSRSSVVPPRHLRARSVHRLRREDDSRRARSRRCRATTRARRSRRRSSSARCSARRGRFRAHRPRGHMAIDRQGTGLAILRICIGIFFLFEGIGKIRWFTDTSLLAAQLRGWAQAVPAASWSHAYLERVALPYASDLRAARAARRDHVGRGARRRLLDAVLRARRLLHGAELSVRQRRVVQVQLLHQRLRIAGARVDAGAGVRRRAVAVEHSAVRDPRGA